MNDSHFSMALQLVFAVLQMHLTLNSLIWAWYLVLIWGAKLVSEKVLVWSFMEHMIGRVKVCFLAANLDEDTVVVAFLI